MANNYSVWELAAEVKQLVQDELDKMKFIDFGEVKATYQLENGGWTAEVLLPGAETTTAPLNCLLSYVPKVGDWAAIFWPKNASPVIMDATPMRENAVTPGNGEFSEIGHNHDGVYSKIGHTHDDRYYTQQEITDLLSGYAVSGHNHDSVYSKLSHTHDDDYYLKSEIELFLADKANKNQAAVTPAALLDTFAAAGDPYDAPGYYKDTVGLVHLSGALTGGTLGSAALQLPEGSRPLKTKLLLAISYDGSADVVSRIRIDPDGNVIPLSGSTSLISLDGLSFRAEQ